MIDPDGILSTPISLKELTLLEGVVPLAEPFRSAIGARRERQAVWVRWTDQEGDWGVGECSCRPDPYFNGEFVDGALCVLRDYVFPLLPCRGTLRDVAATLAKVRGWNFTNSAVLDAVFDLMRRKGGTDALDRWPVVPLTRIPAGISLGLFETPEAAVQRVGRADEAGYHRIKMKVAPDMNLDTIAAVRSAFPAVHLGFDANGTLTEDDLPFVDTLAAFRPALFEQPFAPGRIDLSAALKERRPDLCICLDESLDGFGALVSAHRLGALDEVNLKPGRVGGLLEALRIIEYCAEHQLPAWVGGMFETGIGRAANLRVAARLPAARAHDLSPSRRYFTVDVVRQPVEMDAEGYIHFDDDRPVVLDEAIMERLFRRQITLTKT
ncbi:MAG: enolase C-terminal domain-like protein [Rhodothermales bacterium]